LVNRSCGAPGVAQLRLVTKMREGRGWGNERRREQGNGGKGRRDWDKGKRSGE